MDEIKKLSIEETININGGETEASAYQWGRRVGYNLGQIVGSFFNAVDMALGIN